ncbi:glucans biosynthesis glucosyltransferase MdoH [Rhodopseudomonas palustris]|uniref:glucans biosynthesis glucosyltransferase MdoH n=1 Tax=Rhodopseudomonas palustris TaxID=1076 RepID=UPI002ACE6654|nr:glucans biosynthesis glucosyltransferase MdoH [Rhodopseudomonas palustris]WQH00793.1 glucans biosynthesis glucosyltransferase MdoH [Rhodopseudomonas palustris]
MDAVSRPISDELAHPTRRSPAPLPAEAPLAMPEQSFAEAPPRMIDRSAASKSGAWRRLLIMLGTAALSYLGIHEMYQVLQVGGVTVLEGLVLVLFAALFAWVALSFISSLAGFATLLRGWRDDLDLVTDGPLPVVTSRVAMLLPTYNEDPQTVLARLQATRESAEATGSGAQFDWFILSDTTDPAVWAQEEKCFLALAATGDRLFYRHRADNRARKAGNIEDWVKRFGADYDFMIILDADSVMTGDALVRLAAAMERHPDVGLIQTLPVVVNARTLFARLQQFAGRMYGPVIAAGVAWWHRSESNYWGHNAIIRVEAFAACTGLPNLPGRKPFGGSILSHDFVEAALLRRAGWRLHMAPTLRGSYEEVPPTMLDFAARDRRWCQGNLQHAAILPARGLHWVSRLHFLTGIGAYITAPIWLTFLVAGILISLQAQYVRPEYFPKDFSLFPVWPAQDPIRAAWVFAATMGLLIVPKLLALILVLIRRDTRLGFGGGFRAFAGLILETLMSGLTAPVMMIFQSTAVGQIVMGQDSGWQLQHRGDGSIPFRDVARRYALPTLIGIAMATSALLVSWPLFWWMTPVVLGLVLAIPVALLTNRSTPARPALLPTPEDLDPPPILARVRDIAATLPASSIAEDPLVALRDDSRLLDIHMAGLSRHPPRGRGRVDPTVALARAMIDDAHCFEEVVAWLNQREKRAVMGDRDLLLRVVAMPATTASANASR